MALLDLDDYKDAIGETSNDHDDQYQFALDAVSQAILNVTDRDFGAAEVVEDREYPVPDQGFILDIDDASEIYSVEGFSTWRAGTDGPAASYGVYTYIEFPEVNATSPLMGFTRNEDVFGRRFNQTITVNAKFGWPTVPADILQAVVWGVGDLTGDLSNPSGGLAAKSVAEVAENYIQRQTQQTNSEEPLSDRVLKMVLPYRRVSL